MWILLFFDLPTHTATQRKAYTKFRKALKKQNFRRLQYSVYTRYATTQGNQKLIRKICELFPREGDLQIIRVSDREYHQTVHIQNDQRMAVPSLQSSLIIW